MVVADLLWSLAWWFWRAWETIPDTVFREMEHRLSPVVLWEGQFLFLFSPGWAFRGEDGTQATLLSGRSSQRRFPNPCNPLKT